MKLNLYRMAVSLSLLPFSVISLAFTQNAQTEMVSHSQSILQQQNQYQKSELNDSQKQATEWGLTQEEWHRYTELMKGERCMWSPNLDPLTQRAPFSMENPQS